MYQPKPEWLKIKARSSSMTDDVAQLLSSLSLHTVCEEANCPNLLECFGRSTATFMILGRVCTRNCTFCNVSKGVAKPPDPDEPAHVAQAVAALKLRHVVITSATRDDLEDGGAGHFARTIEAVRSVNRKTVIEVLIPDFQGSTASLETVVSAAPRIINHNIETVPGMYPEVRPMAVYERSLALLEKVKAIDSSMLTKSGIMLGLGETEPEVLDVFSDLRKAGCDFLTAGQYLAPSKQHHPVVEYVHPEVFAGYKEKALAMGFRHVAASPLVRSSYMADQAIEK